MVDAVPKRYNFFLKAHIFRRLAVVDLENYPCIYVEESAALRTLSIKDHSSIQKITQHDERRRTKANLISPSLPRNYLLLYPNDPLDFEVPHFESRFPVRQGAEDES